MPPVPYHVVRTDYNSFACVYSCYELFSLMFEAFSILSRTAEVDDASLAACHQAFDELELDLTRLEPVQQTQDCLGVAIEGSGGCKRWVEEEWVGAGDRRWVEEECVLEKWKWSVKLMEVGKVRREKKRLIEVIGNGGRGIKWKNYKIGKEERM